MVYDHRDPDHGRHGEYKRRDRLLPWPKVRELYGISRTTAWRLQKVGEFPQPVHISSGRVGWRESELITWAASRTHREAVRGPTPPRPERPPEPKALARGAATEPDARPRGRRRPVPIPDGQTAFEF